MRYRRTYRRLLAAMAAGILVAATMGACSSDSEECDTDEDCANGMYCNDSGQCVLEVGGDIGFDDIGGDDAGGDVGGDVEEDVEEDTDGDIEIAGLTVEPDFAEIGLGGTLQLTVTAYDQDDNEIVGVDDADFEWDSFDSEIAEVDADGVVTAIALGETTISVNLVEDSSIEAFADIDVVEGEVDTVEVSPSSESIFVGETAQFEAFAFNEAGEEILEPSINWSVDFDGDDTLAEIDTLGEVTALAPGEVTVIANVEGVEGEAELTIELVPVDRVEIDGEEDTIEVGEELELTATAYDDEDNELVDREITWTTSDDEIAEVEDGTVTGVAEGDVTITAEIGGETAEAHIEVVPANNAPIADAGEEQTVEVGDTVELDGTDSSDGDDGDQIDAYQWAFDSTPANSGASLDDPTAAQPSFEADEPGEYVLELTVTDTHGATSTDTVTIFANTPPTADAGEDQDVTEGDTVDLDGTGSSDPDDGDQIASYEWALTTTPDDSGAQLDDATAAQPSFEADEPGEYVVTLTVTDDHGSTDTDTVTIDAEEANVDPEATDDTADVDEDESVTIDVLDNDTDANQDDLIVTITDQPSEGSATVVNNDTQIEYTPAENFNGEDSLTYQVDDQNGGTDTATVTITVNAVNDAPVADAGTYNSVVGGQSVTLDASASSDVDDDDLTYEWALDAPDGSDASISPTDTVDPTLSTDIAGTYEVTVTVSDGEDTDTDTAEITATAPDNNAPVAEDDTASVDEDDSVTIDVLDNDADDDDDDLVVTISSEPSNGSATVTDDEQIEYTPEADFNGEDELTYEVDDQNGGADTATVTITVAPVNDAPEAAEQDVETTEDTDVSITLAGSDIDDDAADLTFAIAEGPENGSVGETLDEDAGTLTYTPDGGFSGTDSFTFTVSDGTDTSAPATVTIEVAAAPEDCLIISEYVEGSSNNKAIEIYNCGDAELELTGYEICLETNGSDVTGGGSCTNTEPLSGTLPVDETFVICNGQFSDSNNVCDTTSGISSFNGDDRLFIYENADPNSDYDHGTDVVVDAFGDLGDEPSGEPWAGVTYDRCDFTPHDGEGGFDPDALYTAHDEDTFSGLGEAPTETCGPTPEPVADAGDDVQADLDEEVTLEGSATDDEDDAADLELSWEVTTDASGDEDYTFTDNDDGTATFEASTAGDYVLTLTATDSDANVGTDTVTVTVVDPAAEPAGDCLIISEYVDAGGNDKAIEVYNCGDDTIDMDEYGLCLEANGNDVTNGGQCTNYTTSAQLAAGETYVICNGSHQFSDSSICDDTGGVAQFNGDDRPFIYSDDDGSGSFSYADDTVVDSFGELGNEPSSTIWGDMIYDRCDFATYDGTGTFDATSYYTEAESHNLGDAPEETCAP